MQCQRPLPKSLGHWFLITVRKVTDTPYRDVLSFAVQFQLIEDLSAMNDDADILRRLGWPDELIEAALRDAEPISGADRIDLGIATAAETRTGAPVAPPRKP